MPSKFGHVGYRSQFMYTQWSLDFLNVLWRNYICPENPRASLGYGYDWKHFVPCVHAGLWLLREFPRCAQQRVHYCQMLTRPPHFSKASAFCYVCRLESGVGVGDKEAGHILLWSREWLLLFCFCLTPPPTFINIIIIIIFFGRRKMGVFLSSVALVK